MEEKGGVGVGGNALTGCERKDALSS